MIETEDYIEIWKPVPDYPNYIISSFGNIFNVKTKKPLKPVKDYCNNGDYERYRIALGNEFGRKMFVVAKLMLETFIGPHPDPTYTADHIDNDPLHNHLSNLRWASRRTQMLNRRNRNEHYNIQKVDNSWRFTTWINGIFHYKRMKDLDKLIKYRDNFFKTHNIETIY